MGNERSGRGGIAPELFDRCLRLHEAGKEAFEIQRETGVDRKTCQKIKEGTHIFQREGKLVPCPVCRRRVDKLPCIWCLSTPLEVEPRKLDPRELGDELFERDETAEAMFPALVRSVRELGMVQPPLVVRATDPDAGSDWLVVMGGRRIRAAIEAGLPTVLCFEVTANRQQQYDALLSEEFMRTDRNVIERARMLGECLADPEVAHTQKTLGERLGYSQSFVARHLALLKLPEYWQRDLLMPRGITEAHARCLTPHADNHELLFEIWRDLDHDTRPSVEAFRDLVAEHVEAFEARKSAANAANAAEDSTDEEDGPLDELLRPPPKKERPKTRDLKLRYSEDHAVLLESKLAVIANVEGCDSWSETVWMLVERWEADHPNEVRAAALGLRKVA